ncbi:MAG: diguanylate cyclase [Armatimonadota bacterium]|nr:diguanylate cyclase [Armatimonadota bacterium]MDR7486345.1 diguanylate cyclase [Armatimonadota bacterium]MDR7534222.1 diguanylate cyclase [Armatimonadota bacterium]MDR7536762.1 diguanylate cyclase [Armatimonadota bacterium]
MPLRAQNTPEHTPAEPSGVPAELHLRVRSSALRLRVGSRAGRVLVVDDDAWVRNTLRKLEQFGAQVEVLEGPEGLLEVARQHRPDVIIIDGAIPDASNLIKHLGADPVTHPIPVLVLLDRNDVEGRVRALEDGAFDCLTTPFHPPEVLARVEKVLHVKGREDALRRRITFLEELATSDPLTSLLNRRALEERLYLEMERARRSGHPLSCLILDIDWFKDINDRYGHKVGDDVIRQLAKVVLERKRDRDVVCRYGGEEFVWLLPGIDKGLAVEMADLLRRAVHEIDIPTGEGSFNITISVGVSTYQWKEHGRQSAEALLERADQALYQAKEQGKNRVVYLDPSVEHPLEEAAPGQNAVDLV